VPARDEPADRRPHEDGQRDEAALEAGEVDRVASKKAEGDEKGEDGGGGGADAGEIEVGGAHALRQRGDAGEGHGGGAEGVKQLLEGGIGLRCPGDRKCRPAEEHQRRKTRRRQEDPSQAAVEAAVGAVHQRREDHKDDADGYENHSCATSHQRSHGHGDEKGRKADAAQQDGSVERRIESG